MNTTPETRLLELYDRVAEAPEAIDRLRKFVLDLAVRGKLVEQDPEDEPQPKLLDLDATDKAEKHKPPLSNWMAAKLGNVLNFQYGKGLKKSERLEEGPVPVFGSNGIVGFTTEALTDNPSIIVGRKGSAGALNLCDRPSWTTDVAYFVEAPQFFDLNYLLLALQALDLDALGKGVKPGLSRADAYELVLSIPPLPEQHRIVKKVDELMALLDRLETTRTQRETTRDRLTTASLTRLTAPDTTKIDFPGHARFALDNLDQLTSRPDQIKVLRQTILNLAVQGQLVEQDPGDEPAHRLLERAKASQADLVKTGEAPDMKAVAPVQQDDHLFDLPPGWSWARLGQLSQLITKGSSPKWQGIHYVDQNRGVLFVTSENVGVYKLRKLDAPKYVEHRFNEIQPRSVLQKGDLLVNLVGASIGRAAQFDLDLLANINQAVALIRPITAGEFFDNQYILYYLNSPTGITEMLGSRVIAAQPNISLTDTRNFLVPLPPLDEQHRIVAKVDELMALCDKLEAAKTAAETTQARLLEVLLHGALVQDAQNQEAA